MLEWQEQAALIVWRGLLHARYPMRHFDKRLFAIPNGAELAGGDRVTRAKKANALKREGLVPGVWDLLLDIPQPVEAGSTLWYAGLYIEMKVGRNTLSAAQEAFRDAHEGTHRFVVAYSWQEAAQAICDYLGIERYGC